MTAAGKVFEKLVYSPLNHMPRLLARVYFIENKAVFNERDIINKILKKNKFCRKKIKKQAKKKRTKRRRKDRNRVLLKGIIVCTAQRH
jgi:hypothetical protein